MANYNDGKWHGWNGGECPVHPKSTVEVRWLGTDEGATTTEAGHFAIQCWTHEMILDACNHIVAFRVIKEHREPREFWIAWPLAGAHAGPHVLIGKPSGGLTGYRDPIHVREVL